MDKSRIYCFIPSATNLKWKVAGNMKAIGVKNKLPTTEVSLSIVSSKYRPMNIVNNTNIALLEFLNHFRLGVLSTPS